MDMAQVESAAAAIGDALAGGEREHVVVVKSTVLPRMTEELVLPRVLERSGRDRASVGFAMNPEFLREGSAVADALAPDRIVIGAADGLALAKLRELYTGAKCPVLECDPRTAEMVKYASNAFLAAKVSYANEVANLCEAWGIDFATVAEGMGLDDRISPRFLRAGAGYGGSCFPKDVKALRAAAAAENLPAAMLDATLAVNESQPLLLVAWARDALGSLEGKRVAILGLAFKPETDDVREARAAVVARALLDAGASVVGCDPQAAENFGVLCDIEIAPSAEAALAGADCAILMTEWPEYAALPPAVFEERMARPLLLDGRRAFDAAAMRNAGVEYRAIGLGGSE
jgi:UDPglucose 6-dehydrogenase